MLQALSSSMLCQMYSFQAGAMRTQGCLWKHLMGLFFPTTGVSMSTTVEAYSTICFRDPLGMRQSLVLVTWHIQDLWMGQNEMEPLDQCCDVFMNWRVHNIGCNFGFIMNHFHCWIKSIAPSFNLHHQISLTRGKYAADFYWYTPYSVRAHLSHSIRTVMTQFNGNHSMA